MSFGSGFIIGQMLGNSNSSYQKHALEQENYELKRKNDKSVQKMHILEQQLQEANEAIKKVQYEIEEEPEIKTGAEDRCWEYLDDYLEKWGVK